MRLKNAWTNKQFQQDAARENEEEEELGLPIPVGTRGLQQSSATGINTLFLRRSSTPSTTKHFTQNFQTNYLAASRLRTLLRTFFARRHPPPQKSNLQRKTLQIDNSLLRTFCLELGIMCTEETTKYKCAYTDAHGWQTCDERVVDPRARLRQGQKDEVLGGPPWVWKLCRGHCGDDRGRAPRGYAVLYAPG